MCMAATSTSITRVAMSKVVCMATIMCMAGGGREGAAHSPFISDGGRRKAAQKGAQSSWDRRRATKGASAPVCPSSAPVCLSIQAGEHLSQGDNLTPEGTFEALNSTFVPREEYM